MLNERIHALRVLRNMSQVELAKQLGVTKQSVSNWENDNILPSIDMLIRIADFFSTTTDYLLGLEDREFLDVSGLDSLTISHLRQLIDDIKNTQKNQEGN